MLDKNFFMGTFLVCLSINLYSYSIFRLHQNLVVKLCRESRPSSFSIGPITVTFFATGASPQMVFTGGRKLNFLVGFHIK